MHACMHEMCMLILHFVLVMLYCTAELKDIVGYHNVSKEKVREGGRCGLLCGKYTLYMYMYMCMYMCMYMYVVWGFVHIYAVHTGYKGLKIYSTSLCTSCHLHSAHK